MRILFTCITLAIVSLTSLGVKAQDSIGFFEKQKQIQSLDYQVLDKFYTNPALKVTYSDFSFSNLGLTLEDTKNDFYLKQRGDAQKSIRVATESFQRLDSITSIWGSASYVSQKQAGISFNSNLDIDHLGPYVMADSTKATQNYQSYRFQGGYAKTLNRFALGASLVYQANMGYRTKDPRPKSISSSFEIKLGLAYKLHSNWSLDAYTLFSKYTQNTNVKFANEVAQASLYQMQGLGYWNNYFSSKSTKTIFEEFGYTLGAGLSKNKDLSVGFTIGRHNLDKLIFSNIGNDSGDALNTLSKKHYSFFATKTFDWDNHKLALKVVSSKSVYQGTDILYSNNDKYLIRLMERENYKLTHQSHHFKLYYSFNAKDYTLGISPYFTASHKIEQSKVDQVGQEFQFQYMGLNLDYYQKLNQVSALRLSPFITFKNVSKAFENLEVNSRKQSIAQWLENDYRYYATNSIQVGTSLTYQWDPLNFPLTYIELQYNMEQFKTKQKNQYVALSLGVTF